MKQTSSRNVLNVVLLGDPRVGKSTIVKNFLQRNRQTEIEQNERKINMAEVQFPNGTTKKVIFTEVQTMDLTDSSKHIELDRQFDVICICFEHPNYLKKFMQEKQPFLHHPVPKMALMCKNDEKLFDRRTLETKEFSDMGLKVFAECSARNGDFSNFTHSLLKVVDNP